MGGIDHVIHFSYPVVLLVGADQTQDDSVGIRSVVFRKQRFIRTRSEIGGHTDTRRWVKARNVRAERADGAARGDHIVAGIDNAILAVACSGARSTSVAATSSERHRYRCGG